MELVVQIGESPFGGEESRNGPSAADGAGAALDASQAIIPEKELAEASDDALVRAAVAGQREAFSELLKRYVNLLFWFLGGRVDNQLEVEEIAQEALVRAFEGLPRLRVPRAFPNWLVTIADNTLRERGRRDPKTVPLEDAGGALQARSDGPVEKLSEEEFRVRMKEEMLRLPPHYRTVLALKYMNGCSVDEIANRLQIPEGTVRGRLSRAYGILRSRLGALAPWAPRRGVRGDRPSPTQ